MNELRRELGIPDLPIIIGGLGEFLANFEKYPEVAQNYIKINRILQELGEQYPHCAFVSAEGLDSNPDRLHFSTKALKELGVRYYRAYEPLAVKRENGRSHIDAERTELELL